MNIRLCVPYFLLLSACSSVDTGNNFYSWVDENGNIRTTEKKETKQSNRNNINEDDYISSTELDRKMRDTRLYSWQDESGQHVMEGDKVTGLIKEIVTAKSIDISVGHIAFREGRTFLFSNIKNTSISLEDYYYFNQQKGIDYILIELDEKVNTIVVKSFITKETVAMPDVIPLTSRYEQISKYENIWSRYSSETWRSYPHFSGELSVNLSTKYLLIKTSSNNRPIMVEGELVKLSHFGVISISVLH